MFFQSQSWAAELWKIIKFGTRRWRKSKSLFNLPLIHFSKWFRVGTRISVTNYVQRSKKHGLHYTTALLLCCTFWVQKTAWLKKQIVCSNEMKRKEGSQGTQKSVLILIQIRYTFLSVMPILWHINPWAWYQLLISSRNINQSSHSPPK